MKLASILFLITTLFCSFSFAEDAMTKNSQLPAPVQDFLKSVKDQDSTLFESLLSENIVVDDWGKIIKGKKDTLAFSESHLIKVNAIYEVSEVKDENGNVLLDGTWKSASFTGPTRFIFELKDNKIQKLIISSPRWFDRAYIKIKSMF